ncbi:hypothetical protein [Cohnella faecalis]|uniref:hypothetical protein n=1 Tax=Cohnella faecalis TaxID=2315694 RepID=UPI001F2D9B0D|nr:hypothetical protein [Cohnella faecalis]
MYTKATRGSFFSSDGEAACVADGDTAGLDEPEGEASFFLFEDPQPASVNANNNRTTNR